MTAIQPWPRAKSDRAASATRSPRALILAAVVAAACLAVVAATRKDETVRRLDYRRSGKVQVDGMTLYLNPDDRHLTEIVLATGAWEPEETRSFRQHIRPGDTVVDVGANIGWYTVIASQQVGPQGRVIAFEPDPANFALLKRNVEANGCRNVLLEQQALSDQPGKLQLFLNDTNKGMHSTALPQNPEQSAIEVDAIRLDDYMQQLGGSVHVVKIDVEGAEGFVLDGMTRILREEPRLALLLEFAPQRLADTGYDPQQLLERLAAQQFRVWQIDGFTRQTIASSPADVLQQCSARHLVYMNLLLARDESPAQPSGSELTIQPARVGRTAPDQR